MENFPRSRKKELVVQEMDGEVLIYDLRENKAFCLNETSALVWEACDGNKSVSEIGKAVGKKLNSPVNDDLVWLALDQLKKESLIENGEEIVSMPNGMSRRDVIKKVGLGTMIALPIVTSLVAPTAAQAASPATCGQACNCPNNTPVGGTCGQGVGGTTCGTGCTCTRFANTTAQGGFQDRCA